MTVGQLAQPEARSSEPFAILVAACDLPEVRALITDTGVSAQVIEDVVAQKVVQRDGASQAVAIDGSDKFVGVLTTSPQGMALVERHKQELAILLDVDVALDLSKAAAHSRRERVATWLVGLLSKASSTLLSDVRSVRRALVTLRVEHEETLERFSLLEASTSHFVTPQRVEKLHLAPSVASVELVPSTGEGRARLRQVLPIQALGLGAVELFLDGVPAGGQGTLTLDLLLGSSKVPAYRWVTDAKHLVKGCNVFILHQALGSRERDPVLDVSWTGPTPISLRLSAPNPIFDFCAVVEGANLLRAPLALRAWGTVPGLRLVHGRNEASHVGARSHAGEAADPISFALSSSELEAAKLIHPTGLDLGWSVVDFRVPTSDILVHPLDGQTTIAMIRNVNVRGLKQLSALVHLENENASPVDFSLGAVTQKAHLSHPADLPKRWTTVGPQTFSDVAGTIDIDPDAGQFDLFLATRMHDNAKSTLAWAFFKRIEVTV